MFNGHDHSIVECGRDRQFVRQRLLFDDERMVAAGGCRIRNTFKYAATGMPHRRRTAVNWLIRVDDAAAKGLPDDLVAQTDAKDWNFVMQLSNEVQ